MPPLSLAGLHDAHVTGIFYDALLAELTLRCRASGGEVQLLVFFGVKSWRLSEFEDQNVVFAIAETAGEEWIGSEQGREEYFEDVVATIGPHDVVFGLESSTGMEGCIVAKGYRLE